MTSTTIERILTHQLEQGLLDNVTPSHARGIAQRAVDNSFDSLSQAQKNVLTPFLSSPCTGVTDPGGYHNNCDTILTDESLLDAYDESEDSSCLECENCRNEAAEYAAHWERFSKD